MNVVDSSGWIKYFAQGENPDFCIPLIRDLEHLIVPTIYIYEVFKRLLAERDEDSALLTVGIMLHGHEVELDRSLALEAAQISHEHKLAMTDCIVLAVTQAHEATLWTQDEHFQGLSSVRYVEKK